MGTCKYLGTFEMSNGDYYEVTYNEDKQTIQFGDCTNAGFAPMYTFECEGWATLDQNLMNAYEDFCEKVDAL